MSKQGITVKEIRDFEVCSRNAFFSSMGFYEGKTKYSHMNEILKRFIKEFDFTQHSYVDAKNIFKGIVSNSKINSENFEEQKELELLEKQLFRYLRFEKGRDFKFLNKNIKTSVIVNGVEIEVEVDVVFEEYGTIIHMVKYFRSAPTLTMQNRKSDSSVKESVEMYLLQLLGESMYPNKMIVVDFIYLKSKKDTSKEFVLDFEDANCLITNQFNYNDSKEMEKVKAIQNKILNIYDAEKNFLSVKCEKNCSDCKFNLVCNYEKPKKYESVVISQSHSNVTPSKLNPTSVQKKAIESDSGVIRINAGAGSGKTTVISARVAHLIKNGTLPENIFLTTFTNKGAEEIRERIALRLKSENIDIDAKRFKVFTFNSFGDFLIKKHFGYLGFQKEPIIADKVDKYDIIYNIIKNSEEIEGLDYRNPLMSMPNAKGAVPMLDALIAKYSSKQYTAEEFVIDVNKDDNLRKFITMTMDKFDKFLVFYFQFQEEFISKNFIQYQDQINYALELFLNEMIFDEYGVEHIMVDEYQDTDGVQLKLIQLLNKHYKTKSLMVVGDDSQAIFGFRNVLSENIINFSKDFSKVTDIYLVDNFRSTPEIIYTANKLNEYNKNKINKQLVSKKANGKKPVLTVTDNADMEYEEIANQIQQQINSGKNPMDIAVIARQKTELIKIQGFLNELKIPSVMHTPIKLIDNIHVKIICALGTFLYKPVNDVKLLEYVNAIHHDELKTMNNSDFISFYLSQKASIYLRFKNSKTSESKKKLFFELISKFEEGDLEVQAFVEYLKKRPFTFEQMVKYLHDFVKYEGDQSINPANEGLNAVVLITAHSSKGKEYPVVFNTLNKYKFAGNFISDTTIEEERRLLFVSMTRAKDELYLSYNKKDIKHRLFETELHGVEKHTIS